MGQKITLKIVLLIALLTGLFPCKITISTTSRVAFKWRSPLVLYSAITLFLTFAQCDLALGAMFEHVKTASLAAVIVLLATLCIIPTSLFIMRLFALYHASQLVTLVEMTKSIRGFCDEQKKNRKSSGFVAMNALIGFYVVTCTMRLWSTRRFWLLFDKDNEAIDMNSFKLYLLTPLRKFKYFMPFFTTFVTLNTNVCQLLSLGLVLSLSLYMLSTYNGLMGILLAELSAANDADMLQISPKNRISYNWPAFAEQFSTLRHCFGLYRNIVGFYALLVFVHETISAVYGVYFLIWPGAGVVAASVVPSTIIDVIILVSIGNFVHSQVNTTLADVNELRMKIQIKSPHVQLHSQILATAEMVSIVQGDLSAVDFVSINHALLPTFLGTLATCLIFVIQLEMSQTTGNITTSNCTCL